jgi:RHS repeat-associated protein
VSLEFSGTIVWRAAYLPFGKAQLITETITNNFRFPGQYFDEETGLHYNMHRYYNPATGRYMTPDPIGLEGGINLYGFVQNDPVNFVDPWGLYTEIIIWQPVGHGISSFGHISSNVNGTNYSWGPNGWDTKYPNASDYADRQGTFREGVGVVLNLTPDQEQRLEECYARKRGEYSTKDNNCAAPHQECLSEVLGTTLTDTLFPVDFGNALLDSSCYKGSIFYQGPN